MYNDGRNLMPTKDILILKFTFSNAHILTEHIHFSKLSHVADIQQDLTKITIKVSIIRGKASKCKQANASTFVDALG